MKKVKLVLDTNVFIVSLPDFSPWHWIIKAIIDNQIILLITNDILMEWDEKLLERYSAVYTNDLLDLFLQLENVYLIEPSYKWNFIAVDPDDNKFVDCAIAGNADLIVSNDRHFQILKQIDFPRVNILRLQEFENLYKEQLG